LSLRALVRLSLALALGLVAPGPARADLLQDLGATFEQVARELAAAFPKAETRVTAVDGDTVRLAGAGVSALRPGLELAAYRKGEPFRNPLTGQIIGHSEQELAVVTVTAVEGDAAVARFAVTDPARTPRVGDGARITAGRIPVAVLPTLGVQVSGETPQETSRLLASRFAALLDKTGRFLSMDPQRVLEVAEPRAGAPPSALEVAQKLKAPAVLHSRLVQAGRSRHLETAWISGSTGATLVSLRTPLAKAHYPPRFAWEQTPELERRQELDGPVRGLALGDLDGDGRPELVVADDRGLSVYRAQENAGLGLFTGPEPRPSGQIVSLDAADLNGTGRAQVVVVEHRGGLGETVRSSVLEWTGGGFRPLYEVSGRYLRVLPAGQERWLVEQSVGQTEPFDTTVRRLVWDGRRYTEAVAMRVPNGVSLYGLALLRLTGSAQPELVAIMPEDRLAVFSAQGRRLWTSADSYGGGAITFPFQPAIERRDPDPIVARIQSRVVALPDAGEGPEILLFENLLPFGSQFRTLLPRLTPTAFTQGRVHRLRWKDGGFVRVWESRPTEGYVADIGYGDVNADGVPDVVVGVVPRGLNLDTLNPFGRPKGHLLFFELP
jgi:hypothetical protein